MLLVSRPTYYSRRNSSTLRRKALTLGYNKDGFNVELGSNFIKSLCKILNATYYILRAYLQYSLIIPEKENSRNCCKGRRPNLKYGCILLEMQRPNVLRHGFASFFTEY